MTWIVHWNGKEYDADPSEFSGLELKLVKERTGLGFWDLIRGIPKMDEDAARVTFWIIDRRADPELKFSDYHGPSMRVILPALPAFGELVEELGKAVNVEVKVTRTTETPGTQSSPNGTPDAPSDASTTD